MDLFDTLRKKIDVLDEGDYLPGLRAVLLHIETAFRHLSRGQDRDDDTAFTDAIYRTNLAFEGSIKEAYRVLAGKDPAKMRPYDIENYLEEHSIFRPRVLSQLTTYRTEWRNPSTHDYKLDFDESEAFLAIVSVSAFACLLLDQMAERLAYARSQAEAKSQKVALEASLTETKNADLVVWVSELLAQFCVRHLPALSPGRQTESQIIGTLHGFLSFFDRGIKVHPEAVLVPGKPFRADLLIERKEERVVVELKRHVLRPNYLNAIGQIQNYLLVGGIKNGILLMLPEVSTQMERIDTTIQPMNARLVVMAPKGSNLEAIVPILGGRHSVLSAE